jgi:hypothetical protein
MLLPTEGYDWCNFIIRATSRVCKTAEHEHAKSEEWLCTFVVWTGKTLIYENEVPCSPKLLPIRKKKIHFTRERSFHGTVKRKGFTLRKCNSERDIIVDESDIVVWISRCLKQTQKYRNNGDRYLICTRRGWKASNHFAHICKRTTPRASIPMWFRKTNL